MTLDQSGSVIRKFRITARRPAATRRTALKLGRPVGTWSTIRHHNVKSQPLSGWDFFLPVPPVLARFPGMASRATPLRKRRLCPRRRLSVLCYLRLSRERSRGHFLCWRRFRGGRLWLATPVAGATQYGHLWIAVDGSSRPETAARSTPPPGKSRLYWAIRRRTSE